MIPRTLKNFTLTVDGVGYAGRVKELTLPTLSIKAEEYRGGGMDAPFQIDMGQEALEAEFVLSEYNEAVIGQWGLADQNAVQLTARGAMQRSGEDAVPIVCNVRGSIKEIDFGAFEAGEITECNFMMAVHYYRLSIDGADVLEVDVENMIRVVNGADQLASMRTALGI